MLLCIAGLRKEERRIALRALQHVSDVLKRVLHDGMASLAVLEGNKKAGWYFCYCGSLKLRSVSLKCCVITSVFTKFS